MSGRTTLGSRAVQTGPSVHVQVGPQTCHDLSLFKDLLKEYRKLDDSITMRLNRANAFVRDQEREGSRNTTKNTSIQDEACLALWQDLVGNWSRRTKLINYCVNVMDESVDEKQKAVQQQVAELPSQKRKLEGAMYEDEVKARAVRDELTVEKLVRNRTMTAFRSRCKYFTPPLNTEEARQIWKGT
ncbi:caffeine-induced death protein 2-domain-containing protein [Mycena floridula]|nr:caffeine-induced death protein 2-domain-containing protein [Mycena floridula]